MATSCTADAILSAAAGIYSCGALIHSCTVSAGEVTLGGEAVNTIPGLCSGTVDAALPSSAAAIMYGAFLEVFSSRPVSTASSATSD